MSEEQSRLLADIRELSVEMESPRLSLKDQSYLVLCADILKQVRADGVPMYPVVEFVKSAHSVERDNDGQSVIYLDDAGRYPDDCHVCGEPCEIQVEDGDPCLECQASGE